MVSSPLWSHGFEEQLFWDPSAKRWLLGSLGFTEGAAFQTSLPRRSAKIRLGLRMLLARRSSKPPAFGHQPLGRSADCRSAIPNSPSARPTDRQILAHPGLDPRIGEINRPHKYSRRPTSRVEPSPMPMGRRQPIWATMGAQNPMSGISTAPIPERSPDKMMHKNAYTLRFHAR